MALRDDAAVLGSVVLGASLVPAIAVGVAKLFGASWKTAAAVGGGALLVEGVALAATPPRMR